MAVRGIFTKLAAFVVVAADVLEEVEDVEEADEDEKVVDNDVATVLLPDVCGLFVVPPAEGRSRR